MEWCGDGTKRAAAYGSPNSSQATTRSQYQGHFSILHAFMARFPISLTFIPPLLFVAADW